MTKERICIRTTNGWVCEPPVRSAEEGAAAEVGTASEEPPPGPKDRLKRAIAEELRDMDDNEVEYRREDIVKVVKLLLKAYEFQYPLEIKSDVTSGDGLF